MMQRILRLPHRPLLSHLHRHVRRHDAAEQHAVPPRLRHLMMIGASRGYASDANSGAAGEIATAQADMGQRWPPAAAAKKNHLYVVLHDRENAYSIHKLDVAGGGGGDDDRLMNAGDMASPDTLPRLPEPPVLRLQHPRISYYLLLFSAVGSSIVTMGEYLSNYGNMSYPERDGFTLVYDTKTAALTVVRHVPEALLMDCYSATITVGNNRLYVLECNYHRPSREENHVNHVGGMHCFRLTDDGDGDAEGGWRWRHPAPDPSTTPISWSADPLEFPFFAGHVTAHAVHPEGRTIFISVFDLIVFKGRGGRRNGVKATYSFNTEGKRWTPHWTPRGDWTLPFRGHGHYDGELDSWVGLHFDHDDLRLLTDGRLCACRVVPAERGCTPPEVKVSKEKVFVQVPGWEHVDAELVYMGGRSEYRLVEWLRREGDDEEECLGDGDKCVLRLTTFRVVCDDNGELTATARRLADCYKFSKYEMNSHTAAFWM